MRIDFMNYFRLFALSLITLLATQVGARAETPDADLDAANRAYQDGHYDESAKLFRQLIETHGYSAPLCFNLGNAEAKAGHLGQALLNYERARYLAPGDSGINHNLQVTRKQAGLDPNPYRWWQVVMRSINWTVWLAVIVTCLVLLLIAVIGTASAQALSGKTGASAASIRRFFKGLSFFCVPLFLFFGFVELSTVGFNDRIEGVVMGKPATLRLSPFDSAEKTGTLPEGELVTVEQRHDNYFWVDDASKQSGWVVDKELEPVVPGTFEPSDAK